MATRPTFWRYVRIACAILAFVVSVRLSYHQWIYQGYLAAQYITWEDFPPLYAETLRAKEWEVLEAPDYEQAFLAPAVNSSASIPPLIHFVWFDNLYPHPREINTIPSHGTKAPKICGERNPNLTVKIWSADEAYALIERNFAWFLPTYDAYRYPIQRVDAFKYFLLYHHGGIYMDMDIECRRSLEPLLPFPAWFPEASPFGVNNDLMATRAGHPVLGSMIDNLKARNKDLIFPYLTIFWSTGPQFASDLLKRWFLDHGTNYKPGQNKSIGGRDEWYVLPREFYSEEFTFFGHTPGGSWHEDDVMVILWLVAHPLFFWMLVCGLLSGSLVLIIARLRRRKAVSPKEA